MFRQLVNRLFQFLALYAPGAESLRVTLHRMRGVKIGSNVFIGTSAIIETEYPQLVSIGNNVTLGIRTVIVAHFRETTAEAVRTNTPTVVIEDDVFMGPGVIILQNVRIGKGAVVAAGSVVNTNVPEATLVQGNPAKPVARCGVALTAKTSYAEFTKNLLPLR